MTNDQKETTQKKINMSNLTEEEIEELAIKSFQNFGTPERCMCGECGVWFKYLDFLEHPCVKDTEKL